MKTYKLNGLEIYVVDAPSIEMAVMYCLSEKIGLTMENLSEFNGNIPKKRKSYLRTIKLNLIKLR